MTYPFVKAGAPDYGARKGPALGLLYHMAEGGNTVAYLSHSGVARGVSVHAVCEYSGRVVQMLHWDRASGSLNPRDTSTDKAFYGRSTLVEVLGDWSQDPNSAVLSMEIEGFAAKGPNPAQVDGAVAWGEDMKGLFSSLRGAIGHADQTNTKACPGTTLAMRLVFEGVGGHGLWHPQSGPIDTGGDMLEISDDIDRLFDIPVGVDILDASGKKLGTTTVATPDHASPFVAVIGATHYLAFTTKAGGVQQLGLIHLPDARNVRPAPVPSPVVDCTAQVNAALDHVAGPAAATVAAIAEARPR